MSPCKTYFEAGDRHIVVVEKAPDMATAEKEADQFLRLASEMDEGATTFTRIQVSGIKREDKYYFKVVAG
jgi:hypothetical protein